MFQSLVVSTFRWALGAVVPSQGLLKAARVQGTTLIVWLLGLSCHRAWFSMPMLSRVRHVAKYWHSVYGTPWDVLLLVLHLRLVGHMARSTSQYVKAAVGPTEIFTPALREGVRRARTGPDFSGVRRLQAWLGTGSDGAGWPGQAALAAA
jgi:hypothetical protein